MVNNEVFLNHKKMRVEQIADFEFVRFRCLHEGEAQPCCKTHDGEIERTTNGTLTNHWLGCDAEMCGCQLYGESERSLERKGLSLTKL